MTTIRWIMNREILALRRRQKKGLLLMLAFFGAAGILNIATMNCSSIRVVFILLLALPGYYGAYLLAKAFYDAWKKLACPVCGKALGYLLIDRNYSRWPFSFVYLPLLPRDVECCPYCQCDFATDLAPVDTTSAVDQSQSMR